MRTYVLKPKPPIQLFIKQGEDLSPIEHHICGECKFIKTTEQFAADCCRQFLCESCGKDCNQYQTSCSECADKKRMDRLEEVDQNTFGGPVYCEQTERWFESYDDAVEHFSDRDEDQYKPDFVFPCQPQRIKKLDADDVLENYTEDMFEDALDNLNGVDDFKEAVERFNNANDSVMQWDTIPGKKIRLVLND